MGALKRNDLYLSLLSFVIQNNSKLFQTLVQNLYFTTKDGRWGWKHHIRKNIALIYWTFLVNKPYFTISFKFSIKWVTSFFVFCFFKEKITYKYAIEVRLWGTREKTGSFGGLWYVLYSLGRTHSNSLCAVRAALQPISVCNLWWRLTAQTKRLKMFSSLTPAAAEMHSVLTNNKVYRNVEKFTALSSHASQFNN